MADTFPVAEEVAEDAVTPEISDKEAKRLAELEREEIAAKAVSALGLQDNEMATLMLSLLERDEIHVDLDASRPTEGDLSLREEGARNAYTNWFNEVERRMIRDLEEGDPLPDAGQVQQQMAHVMHGQLSALNGGRAISEGAVNEIQRLMSLGPDGFGDAVDEYRDQHKAALEEHKKQVAAAKAAGKDAPGSPTVGIMAVLMEPNADKQVPNWGDADSVEVTAEAQTEATMHGAFEAMSSFVTGGNGSEIYLAQLHGIRWGENGGMDYSDGGANWMKNEGLNGIRGLHEGSGTARVIAEFTSDDGLSAAGDNYALSDTMSSGAANMDNLFTQALVDRGLVSFGIAGAAPEQVALARSDWNEKMAEALEDGLGSDPDALLAHMQKFANARRDITMTTEPVESRDFGETAATVRGQEEPVSAAQAAAAEAAAAAAERAAAAEVAAGAALDGHIEANATDADASYEISDPRSSHAVSVFTADPQLARVFDPTVPEGAANLDAVPKVSADMAADPVIRMQQPAPLVAPGMSNDPVLNMDR